MYLDSVEAWLLGSRGDVPKAISAQLRNGLFSSVPIFLGGVINTTAIAVIAIWRHPVPAFIAWLLFEAALGAVRLIVLVHGRRRIERGRKPAHLLSALLSCAWAASVGIGTALCIDSGDWVLAAIACLSAAAMVCGMCLRNFGTPRLAGIMVLSALAPCAVAGLLTGEAIVPIISVQLPIFMLTILSASFALNRMMVSRMVALAELQSSNSLNETILQSSPDYILILDAGYRVMFCNRFEGTGLERVTPIDKNWLDLLEQEDVSAARQALEDAQLGVPGSLAISTVGTSDHRIWFDVAVCKTSDSSGRFIVSARDMTRQKKSEESAIWMAQHDALTGLPNRAVLQDRLDAVLANADRSTAVALLILDVDNFKAINDTLGHDAGDALLCGIAERLQAATTDTDLVARTGGDEFALIVSAQTDSDVEAIAERIFERLREPIEYAGRLLEYGASIGASFIPRDGDARSTIMKAADIALYAAKSAGRAQLKIYEPAMMIEVDRHQAMLSSARNALHHDTIVPHYQPKVSLRTSHIVGFEALLRWRDCDGNLRGPDAIKAALEDPALGGLLSNRMLERVLDDIQSWTVAGIEFGHVAINVAGADFRRGGFAETIISRLKTRNLQPSCIQIEVTENVFLGHGADNVEQGLRRLSDHGIRIALDDFGTGYASLSHLHHYPVDILKIDRSFIERLGRSGDAEAISSTVINLGHSLGLEVVAEGIETAAQEAKLRTMGCHFGQGFLYSPALPAASIPALLAAPNNQRYELRA